MSEFEHFWNSGKSVDDATWVSHWQTDSVYQSGRHNYRGRECGGEKGPWSSLGASSCLGKVEWEAAERRPGGGAGAGPAGAKTRGPLGQIEVTNDHHRDLMGLGRIPRDSESRGANKRANFLKSRRLRALWHVLTFLWGV